MIIAVTLLKLVGCCGCYCYCGFTNNSNHNNHRNNLATIVFSKQILKNPLKIKSYLPPMAIKVWLKRSNS